MSTDKQSGRGASLIVPVRAIVASTRLGQAGQAHDLNSLRALADDFARRRVSIYGLEGEPSRVYVTQSRDDPDVYELAVEGRLSFADGAAAREARFRALAGAPATASPCAYRIEVGEPPEPRLGLGTLADLRVNDIVYCSHHEDPARWHPRTVGNVRHDAVWFDEGTTQRLNVPLTIAPPDFDPSTVERSTLPSTRDGRATYVLCAPVERDPDDPSRWRRRRPGGDDDPFAG